MNFIWGAEYSLEKVKDDRPVRLLCSLTIGQPVTSEEVADEVHYRRFKNVIVAVDPTDQEKELPLRRGFPAALLWDLYDEHALGIENDGITLTLPPQSGRVYLYKPSPKDTMPRGNHTLTVKTEPGLGKTRFELDGVPMVTYGGRWTTEYIKGPNYGTFMARFDTPGWHTIKIVDDLRKEMLVANSYQDAYAINETVMPGATAEAPRDPSWLGKFMDPAEPGKIYEGKPYKFIGWEGPVASRKKTIRVHVEGVTQVTARFEQQKR
jgi:hypothetical protein